MEQEEQIDFQALRAKFQQEEFILKKPKIKPVLPEKPNVVSPPQSPSHYLPSGARPSLLTTINQNLERKTLFAPRVVFKDDLKESKKPLINNKDKSEGKLKGGKHKTFKGSRENLLEDSVDQKKVNNKDKTLPLVAPVTQKESTAELVPAAPPPKVTTEKKKPFSLFKKPKRDSVLISADPILDTPSSDIAGPAPLIPVPSESGRETLPNSTSEPHLPDNPTLPDHSADVEMTPTSTTLESLAFNLPPPLIPESPSPEIPSWNSEIPPEIENLTLPVSSQDEGITSPPSVSPPLPPSCVISGSPSLVSSPSPSPPEPEITSEIGKDAIYIPAVEKPPSPATNPPSVPPSPKPERPVSALSALERAEDMSPGRRTPPGDQRIFNALQKARKKTNSPLISDIHSYSVTPPPEESSQCQSPTESLPELPPIDYEDLSALLSKPAPVNGIDHRQLSPPLQDITEGPDPVSELLVIPPPPPKMTISDNGPLNSSVEEPAILNSASLSEFIPPPVMEVNDVPAPLEFSETYTPDVPEVNNVASDVPNLKLQGSELEYEMYPGPDVTDGFDPPKVHSNGITVPQTEIHTETPYGGISQMNELPESSHALNRDLQQASEPQPENDVYQSTENVYEYIATPDGDKKKVKTKVKKHKEPKNPYVESMPVTVQEKTKTGRFGKSEKKAAAEGPDEKELKKKEKQRLEKEKKELKEKQEREKKEQKEREKRENEMKKKFKITGQEDALYQARVVVTAKGRKTDLPVKAGETISIIRTANCPKGKWLARDSSNSYGYVAVDHVELDIKEMLELGRKTLPRSKNNFTEPDGTRMISHVSNHYQLPGESFTDDSEEWSGDDDEPLSSPTSTQAVQGHNRTFSMPDVGNKDLSVNHQHSHSDMGHDSSHNQALQKLSTFFRSQKSPEPAASTNEPVTSNTSVLEEAPHVPAEQQTSYTAGSVNVAEEANHTPEAVSAEVTDFVADTLILPPPVMYADGAE
ncbi:FYN-binding protein 1 isoform X2 [Oreochromis niloticus]|uniref:FYN-binding protein 1 isoform X2 n=1 Tax=Oreochromis niloticus TaxID=8128 RepID=UPI00090504CC|nr:FYN-binding protein 1 isoform X2 [Oreochromis niloticus]CAI5640067.1 unnamed protein product [Mustela putorius furo]